MGTDSAGNMYITGYTNSTNFPTLNPFQPAFAGNQDVFVTKFNPSGSALIYSTYIGGSTDDRAEAMAVDPDGTPTSRAILSRPTT